MPPLSIWVHKQDRFMLPSRNYGSGVLLVRAIELILGVRVPR
jgi:hypothetical protein